MSTQQQQLAKKAREEKLKKMKEEAKQKKQEMLKELKEEQKEKEEKFGKFINFCRKHQLKEKEALWADKRIKYMRSDDFVDFIKEHYKSVKTLLPEFEWEEAEKYIKEDEGQEEKDYDTIIWKLFKYLLEWDAIKRFERFEDPTAQQSTQQQKKKKYPKRLIYNNNPSEQHVPGGNIGSFDKCFFQFGLEQEHKRLALYSSLLILGIAAICLFPVWPLIMKKAIFYISLYLLIFMIGFTIIRLVIYLCFRTLGYSFWVFPNIYDDNVSFVEQFKPLYSNERNDDGWVMYIIRVLLLIWLILAGIYVWNERVVITEQTQSAVDDITEWGLKKMQNQDLPSRALPGYETFAEPEDNEGGEKQPNLVVENEDKEPENEQQQQAQTDENQEL